MIKPIIIQEQLPKNRLEAVCLFEDLGTPTLAASSPVVIDDMVWRFMAQVKSRNEMMDF